MGVEQWLQFSLIGNHNSQRLKVVSLVLFETVKNERRKKCIEETISFVATFLIKQLCEGFFAELRFIWVILIFPTECAATIMSGTFWWMIL